MEEVKEIKESCAKLLEHMENITLLVGNTVKAFTSVKTEVQEMKFDLQQLRKRVNDNTTEVLFQFNRFQTSMEGQAHKQVQELLTERKAAAEMQVATSESILKLSDGQLRIEKQVIEANSQILEVAHLAEVVSVLKHSVNQLHKQVEDHSTASHLQTTTVSTSVIEARSDICSLRTRLDGHFAFQRNQFNELVQAKDAIAKQADDAVTQIQEHKLILESIGDKVKSNTDLEQRLTEQVAKLENRVDPQGGVTTVPADMTQLLDVMEDKFRSYADVTRTVQTSWLEGQERERTARAARSRNLRITGLPENEGEDAVTMAATLFKDVFILLSLSMHRELVVYWNVGGLTDAVIEGNKTLWAQTDLLMLAETWEDSAESKVDIPGFWRLTSVWNQKKFARGRGFGGIGIWLRRNMTGTVKLEHADTRKEFIVLRIEAKPRTRPKFIVAVYFAPYGAPIYSDGTFDPDPFLGITSVIRPLEEHGAVYVVGDFNARILTLQNEGVDEVGTSTWRHSTEDGWIRSSEDLGMNGFTEPFGRFVHTCDLTILNGVDKFNRSGGFTCYSHAGSSTVDFLLAGRDARDQVAMFELGDLVPESDHKPLIFSIMGFPPRGVQRDKATVKIQLDPTHRENYEHNLTLKLTNPEVDAYTLSSLLTQAAVHSFPTRKLRDRSWFDDDCDQARKVAIESSPENRSSEYRKYKSYIRAKKRRWIQARQITLTEELKRRPQIFRRKFRTPLAPSALAPEDLYEYVERLYHSNDGSTGTQAIGPSCHFTEQEISRELARMESGKATDLLGLSMELLKWGGQRLVEVLTRLINATEAYPAMWTHRKVVALYKAGSREDPSSYRTILIGCPASPTLFGLVIDELYWSICNSTMGS
ncbi:hypothetical protein R1sor_027190 [Riccia sorocarpa]|uniref:Endonuclease/exonuclease/phosphatase domain-containing protein n=1 Tax=Riccia sorocarpa TaxID=122646 RepID=A0ABD3GGE1_9MARC